MVNKPARGLAWYRIYAKFNSLAKNILKIPTAWVEGTPSKFRKKNSQKKQCTCVYAYIYYKNKNTLQL